MKVHQSICLTLIGHAVALLWLLSFNTLRAQNGNLLAEVRMNTDFNVIFVPISINGHVVDFVVDTGAPSTSLDSDLAKAWGLPLEEMPNSSEANAFAMGPDFENFEFTIGDQEVTLERVRTAYMKRTGFTGFMGKEFGGILGYDFVNKFVLEVDYQNGLMRIYDQEGFTYSGTGKVIDARITRTRPLIDGVIKAGDVSVPVTLLIDTGGTMFLRLNESFVKNTVSIST